MYIDIRKKNNLAQHWKRKTLLMIQDWETKNERICGNGGIYSQTRIWLLEKREKLIKQTKD